MWIKKCSVERLVTRLGGLEKWKTRVLCCKRKENFCSNCDSYRKKVQSCLAECQCILGQVWCDEKTKHKKQQLPISQRRDNKKSEIAKEESRKVKLKKARWRHFYHNTSCNILWFSFEDYLLIRLQKKSKRKWEKNKNWKDMARSWKLLRISPRHFKRGYIILSGLDDKRLKKKGTFVNLPPLQTKNWW